MDDGAVVAMTGKRLAITTGAIAILVLGISAFVARDRIAEEWWIIRYESPVKATKVYARNKLKQLHSPKIIIIDLKTIVEGFIIYQACTGKYTVSIKDLLPGEDPSGQVIDLIVEEAQIYDPWGRLYLTRIIDGKPHAACYGKDGVPGGDGEDRDYEFPESVNQ